MQHRRSMLLVVALCGVATLLWLARARWRRAALPDASSDVDAPVRLVDARPIEAAARDAAPPVPPRPVPGPGTDAPVPDAAPGPGRRVLAASVVNEVTALVKPAVLACAAAIPREALGDPPLVYIPLISRIRAGTLTVTELASPTGRNVSAAGLASLAACLQQGVVGATTPAVQEADMDGYPITLAFTIPR